MIGTPEQRQAIIDYMIKKDRRTKLEIQNALRYNKAFKYRERPKAEVGAIVNDMIKDKILLKVGGVGASLYLGGMGSAQIEDTATIEQIHRFANSYTWLVEHAVAFELSRSKKTVRLWYKTELGYKKFAFGKNLNEAIAMANENLRSQGLV